MHGVIFGRLKQYVEEKLGPPAWTELLHAAGIGERIYLASSSYPDEELSRLVTTASSMSHVPIADLLEDFGRELVPTYLGMYGHLIKPEWRTLDVVGAHRRDDPQGGPNPKSRRLPSRASDHALERHRAGARVFVRAPLVCSGARNRAWCRRALPGRGEDRGASVHAEGRTRVHDVDRDALKNAW